MEITNFREQVVLRFLKVARGNNINETPEEVSAASHIIMTTTKRNRCASCYETMKKSYGHGHA